MSNDYQLQPLVYSAQALADSYGLTSMERHGLGKAWQTDFVRNARQTNFDANNMFMEGGGKLVNGGMEYSGAMQMKLPAYIAAAGFDAMAGGALEAGKQSDAVAMDARRTGIALAQHNESLAMQHDIAQQNLNLQADSMKKTWFDYMLDTATAGPSLFSLGKNVVNGIGKVF